MCLILGYETVFQIPCLIFKVQYIAATCFEFVEQRVFLYVCVDIQYKRKEGKKNNITYKYICVIAKYYLFFFFFSLEIIFTYSKKQRAMTSVNRIPAFQIRMMKVKANL